MRRVGRYELIGEVARGGMGVIYQARDPRTGREVALKVMREVGSTGRRRFEREGRALSRLRHPNVVTLLDTGTTDEGDPYLVQELVTGESLQRRLDRVGALPWEEAVEVARDLCRAVTACHAAGVLHRDLKPGNVLLSEFDTVKLTDFGLVLETDPTSKSRLSKTGSMQGSPAYWAPEQARGDLRAIDQRTDVYGLGATLFAMLTGQELHVGASLGEILAATMTAPPAPSSIDPRVPTWLDEVVARACAVDPAQRFPNVRALQQALRPGASARRRRGPAAAAALLGLALFGVAWLASESPAPPAPQRPIPASTTPEASGSLSPSARWGPQFAEALGQVRTAPPEVASLGPLLQALRRVDDPEALAALRAEALTRCQAAALARPPAPAPLLVLLQVVAALPPLSPAAEAAAGAAVGDLIAELLQGVDTGAGQPDSGLALLQGAGDAGLRGIDRVRGLEVFDVLTRAMNYARLPVGRYQAALVALVHLDVPVRAFQLDRLPEPPVDRRDAATAYLNELWVVNKWLPETLPAAGAERSPNQQDLNGELVRKITGLREKLLGVWADQLGPRTRAEGLVYTLHEALSREQAEATLEVAYALDPHNPRVLGQLGLLRGLDGDRERCADLIARAAQGYCELDAVRDQAAQAMLSPIYEGLLEIQARRGDPERARSMLADVVAHRHVSPTSAENLPGKLERWIAQGDQED